MFSIDYNVILPSNRHVAVYFWLTHLFMTIKTFIYEDKMYHRTPRYRAIKLLSYTLLVKKKVLVIISGFEFIFNVCSILLANSNIFNNYCRQRFDFQTYFWIRLDTIKKKKIWLLHRVCITFQCLSFQFDAHTKH